jgi:hypothetical protein
MTYDPVVKPLVPLGERFRWLSPFFRLMPETQGW